MGGCNCGHLAQELTTLTKDQIHQCAMQRDGDWNEQVGDYCPISQMPINLLINEILSVGLILKDLKHLERLDDRNVLIRFPLEKRFLSHNIREDVVSYIHAWASLLEE